MLEVADNIGFACGNKILIGSELGTISGFGSIHLARPLQKHHPAGTPVTRVDDEAPNPPGSSTDKYGPDNPEEVKTLIDKFTDKADRDLKAFDGDG